MAQVNLGHVVGPGVPTGGTAGQVLKKNGSTNFDASWTTLNSGNIPISASDNTTVQQSLAAVKSDMGIVEDGNTATHTIAAGQYVIWKGALYTASAAIPSGTTLSSSNLTAVSDGGLNSLSGNIATVNSKITSLVEKQQISTSGFDGAQREAALSITTKAGYNAFLIGLKPNNFNSAHYISYYSQPNTSGNFYVEHNLNANATTIEATILFIPTT